MSSQVEERALVTLGVELLERGYRFVTPTPLTHRRVNARPANARTTSLTGALGWSRPFERGALPRSIEARLEEAGALVSAGGLVRSTVRFSSLAVTVAADGGEPRAALYLHSAHPTSGADAVFFGPDTYRFVAFLRRVFRPAGRLVDVGAGSGAGGLSLLGRAERVVLADINPRALAAARVNAALAGARAAAQVSTVVSDVLAGVDGRIDAVIANPPYLVDGERRLYRDGGGALGFDLALRIVAEALHRLSPGGQLVLYTGSPVVDGGHPLRAALAPLLATRRCRHTWEELDPDVFGEELEAPAYQDVDRVAVVGLVVDVE